MRNQSVLFRVEIGYEIMSKIADSLLGPHIVLWGRELILGRYFIVLKLVWNQVKDCKESVCWSPYCIMRGRAHFGELWYLIVLRLVWIQVRYCKESVCLSPYCIMRGRAHFGELPKWRQVMFAPPSTITLRHKERIASTSKQACKTKRQTWETRSLQMIINDQCVDIRPNSNNCLALSVRHSSC